MFEIILMQWMSHIHTQNVQCKMFEIMHMQWWVIHTKCGMQLFGNYAYALKKEQRNKQKCLRSLTMLSIFAIISVLFLSSFKQEILICIESQYCMLLLGLKEMKTSENHPKGLS